MQKKAIFTSLSRPFENGETLETTFHSWETPANNESINNS